jgi:hypothetical protein
VRNEEPSSRGALNSGLTSADSGLQLDLEIALSGSPAKVQPHELLQPGRRCLEMSADVTEQSFTRSANVCRALFYALHNPLGVLRHKSSIPVPEKRSTFHPHAQRNPFRRRRVRLQSRSFALWNQSQAHALARSTSPVHPDKIKIKDLSRYSLVEFDKVPPDIIQGVRA